MHVFVTRILLSRRIHAQHALRLCAKPHTLPVVGVTSIRVVISLSCLSVSRVASRQYYSRSVLWKGKTTRGSCRCWRLDTACHIYRPHESTRHKMTSQSITSTASHVAEHNVTCHDVTGGLRNSRTRVRHDQAPQPAHSQSQGMKTSPRVGAYGVYARSSNSQSQHLV